jgi:hypothetical protein
MAKKASPAPISTQLNASGGTTNLPWTTWLRETGDFLVSATKTEAIGSCNYTMLGQICFMNVSATVSNGKLSLPYKSLFAKKIQAFLNGSATPVYYDLSAGSSELTVENGVLILSDWYFAKLDG